MVIDMQIAVRLDRDVDAGMPGQEIEHVVEEADAGRNVGHARAIEVDGNLDVGLLGLALDGGAAHEKCLLNGRKRGPFNRPVSPSLLRDGPLEAELPPMMTGIRPSNRRWLE